MKTTDKQTPEWRMTTIASYLTKFSKRKVNKKTKKHCALSSEALNLKETSDNVKLRPQSQVFRVIIYGRVSAV